MASIWTSAAQAAQQGFDESYYLGQKAALLTTQTGTTWTVDMVKASFADAGLQAYEHYQQYGFKEGLNPNAYFNNAYYDSSKAAAISDSESAFQTAWNNANGGSQTSTYFHYLQYGYNESGVNPSATFNEAQYYTDKAALLTAQTGQTWTVAQVQAAFASAGLTPITHYMLYGGTPNEPTPAPVSNVGTTYTLTTGMDTIPGTAYNDTINAGEVAGAKTLTGGDNINGAGGTNTINVFDSNTGAAATYSGFTMQNVQVLNATSDGLGMTFDLSGTTGLTNINSVNSVAAVKADYVTSLANVGVTNATAAANMTVGYQASVVSGANDTVALALNNSSATTVTLGAQGTNAGIETVAITTSGAASVLGQLDSAITNLTFAGDQNLKITTALSNTVKVIDASAATGGLTVTIDATGVAAHAETFTGGAGNDMVTFTNGSLSAADLVAGGTGSDTLVGFRTNLIDAGAAGKVTQVETIKMSDTFGDTKTLAFKGSYFADATTFDLNGGYDDTFGAGGATITSINTATQAVKIGRDLLAANTGVLTITDSATSATGDQATLGIYNTVGKATGTTADVTYTTGELEIVNLVSGSSTATTASANAANTLTLSGGLGNVTTLNISGDESLTMLANAAGNKIVTIAAGTALGDLDLTAVKYSASIAAATDTGASITTGSGADKVAGSVGVDTINVGSGADHVYGTTGADSITLGAGADSVHYTTVGESNALALNGIDTINDFVSGTDKIDLTGMNNVTTPGWVDGTFQGNFADFGTAQAALSGTNSDAVYVQSTNTLWIDANADGVLTNADMSIKLTGVGTLATADITY